MPSVSARPAQTDDLPAIVDRLADDVLGRGVRMSARPCIPITLTPLKPSTMIPISF